MADSRGNDKGNDSRPRPRAVRLRPDAGAIIERKLGGPLVQRDLASRWAVTQATVSRWLSGQHRMPVEWAEDLAAAAELPLASLLWGAQEETDVAAEVRRELSRLLGMTKPSANLPAAAARIGAPPAMGFVPA